MDGVTVNPGHRKVTSTVCSLFMNSQLFSRYVKKGGLFVYQENRKIGIHMYDGWTKFRLSSHLATGT